MPDLTPEQRAEQILRSEETSDVMPPYRCLPPADSEWLRFKIAKVATALTLAHQQGQLEQWKKHICGAHQLPNGEPQPTCACIRCIEEAIRHEREACARIVEESEAAELGQLMEISAAIRGRVGT